MVDLRCEEAWQLDVSRARRQGSSAEGEAGNQGEERRLEVAGGNGSD
jgi:hypothetical protein